MKRLFSLILVLALAAVLPVSALANAANNTFIYGIGGDPGNDFNTIDRIFDRHLFRSSLFTLRRPHQTCRLSCSCRT